MGWGCNSFVEGVIWVEIVISLVKEVISLDKGVLCWVEDVISLVEGVIIWVEDVISWVVMQLDGVKPVIERTCLMNL